MPLLFMTLFFIIDFFPEQILLNCILDDLLVWELAHGWSSVPAKKMKHHRERMLILFLMCLSYSTELHESKCFAKLNSKIKRKRNFSARKTHQVISLGKDIAGNEPIGSLNLLGLDNWCSAPLVIVKLYSLLSALGHELLHRKLLCPVSIKTVTIKYIYFIHQYYLEIYLLLISIKHLSSCSL